MAFRSKLDFRALRKKRSKTGLRAKSDSPTLPTSPVTELPSSLFAAMEHLKTSPRNSRVPSNNNADGSMGREVKSFFNLEPPSPEKIPDRLEDTVRRLFSEEHFNHILSDQTLFQRFSVFVNKYQSQHVPTLIRYLDMRKALKAMEYANAITKRMACNKSEPYGLSHLAAATMDRRLIESSKDDLQTLTHEVLPAFITQVLVGTVVDCVARDITGNTVPAISDLVGRLAEVYCLTDPSRRDNPIIYASEEFYNTTQYGMSYAINRNCRFLQGPETDPYCISRLSQGLKEGRDVCETLLNYRRDGSPFVNLLMMAPLMDDMGKVKYFIGCQVDVTGLVEEGKGIESFRSLLYANSEASQVYSPKQNCLLKDTASSKPLTALKELSQMFSSDEAECVRQNVRDPDLSDSFKADSKFSQDDQRSQHSGTTSARHHHARRIVGAELSDHEPGMMHIANQLSTNGSESPAYSPVPALPGVYQHYLLVRPYPSMQIIFLSPSLRIPGLLRSNFLHKVGGPDYTISGVESAFRDGVTCTAKILWLPKAHSKLEARPRWIRCTPLLGADSRVGVWMVIVMPSENTLEYLDSPAYPTTHQTIESPTSRQSHVSSNRSRSVDDFERREYPIRTANIVRMRKTAEGAYIPIRGASVSGSAPRSPISPVSVGDRDLYAEYIKSPHKPLPIPPRSMRDGDPSRTPSLTSQSFQI